MSTLDIDAIRNYLLRVGCKIEYPILVNAFKRSLCNPDPTLQGQIRTQFKDYVNRLAVVSMESNMKFIILRPEFQLKDDPPKQDRKIVNKENNLTVEVSIQDHHRPQPVANGNCSTNLIQGQQQIQTKLMPPPPIPQHKSQRQHLVQQLQVVSSHHQQSNSIHKSPIVVHQRSHSHQYQDHYQHPYQQPPQTTPPKQSSLQHIVQQTSPETRLDVQDGMSKTISNVLKRGHSMQRPESLNLSLSHQTPSPRPPPRRRQSTASLFKQTLKPIEKSQEIHDLAKRSPGRVREHALKLNSSTSSTDLKSLMPIRNNILKENRLSRESTMSSLSSALHRNGSTMTPRPRSTHREDESDSSSLQPIDPLRRKWALEACNCNYNGLLTLLREDPKLASYKDVVNGYTALHWAAKFGNQDIIKLIAGTCSISANIKSAAGFTPLHVAYMFNRDEAADLLLRSYKASQNIRDHSGKRPLQYRLK